MGRVLRLLRASDGCPFRAPAAELCGPPDADDDAGPTSGPAAPLSAEQAVMLQVSCVQRRAGGWFSS
jgi:hypothetical protein